MGEDQNGRIAWMDVLETGIPDLDDQHQDLIEQCNTLTGLMDRGVPWPEVVAAARGLATDCGTHFRAEEAVLEKTEFPRRDRHAKQHRNIESQFGVLIDFMAGCDGSQPEHRAAARTMRDTLVDVLFRHDLDYKSHLQQALGR
ncbi:MAG TPA: hemerythrin domain-containing protein [Candidatus Binatia bacterium]|nr:hemerythrin domain-containing protein [Candidatus Binatia bacterium]